MRLSRAVARCDILLASVLRESSTQTDMEFTVPNFTLPAMCHIVCQLVTTGISGIDFNNSGVNQLPQQQQLPTLPKGYVAYPDIGFAYKIYKENVNWIEALQCCAKESAQLALIDSAKKVEYIKTQNLTLAAHVGIHRIYGDATWTAVSSGLPLSLLPWQSGAPTGPGNCTQLTFKLVGLGNWDCSHKHNYICEIPIPQNTTVTVN